MKVSEQGLELIAKFEQFRAQAYYATDSERQRGIKTIGYGHVILPNEAHLEGMTLVEEQALILLDKDVSRFEVGVERLLVGAMFQIDRHEFDALVSLAFNIGLGNFENSNIRRAILAGRVNEASVWFKSFTKQQGTRLKGLVRRRAVEKIYYETGQIKYDEVFNGTIDPYKELDIEA